MHRVQCSLDSDAGVWKAVLNDLNAVPVFALADAAGRILQQRETADGQKLVIFYAEVDRALDELAAARESSGDYDLVLKPTGLGMAYAQVQEGGALLVPGFRELGAAQDMQLAAPADAAAMLASAGIDNPTAKWGNDVLPIFGCFEMVRRRKDGTTFTPLFMSHVDAQAAFEKARRANSERAANFEVDVVPLPELLDLAAAGTLKVPPRVIPPTDSMLYLQDKYVRQQE